MTSAGSSDAFILKLDAAGNFVWAKSMGGSGVDGVRSIITDLSGNVYTAGYFTSVADFDPGAATFNLTPTGSRELFVSKLDASGNFVWAKQTQGVPFALCEGRSLKVDAAGNVYTTGTFSEGADFDPGPGSFDLSSVSGSTDIFVLKLDVTGNFVWAKTMGGNLIDDCFALDLDPLGNVYTSGNFTGTADFNPGSGVFNLTSTNNQDVFVSKLDALGNFLWARRLAGTSIDYANAIAVDATGNVYIAGDFISTIDGDPGLGVVTLTSNGAKDLFLAKLDSSGNYLWALNMGGTSDDRAYSIAVDATGNVYTTGEFSNTTDFDPGAPTVNLTSAGQGEIFVHKMSQPLALPLSLINFELSQKENDAYLSWRTATEQNTDKFEIERSIDGTTFNYIGEIKASGRSNTIKSYNFLDKNITKISNSPSLFYRFKLKDADGRSTYSPVRSINFRNLVNFNVYPNPAAGLLTIKVTAAQIGSTFSIADEAGRQHISGKLQKENTIVSISHLVPGMYSLKVGAFNKQTIIIVKQ